MLNLSDIRILYLREIRAALRERNIVLNTILLPVFLYPLLLWIMYTGITFVFGQTEGFVSRVMIRGAPAFGQPLHAGIEKQSNIELISSEAPEDAILNGDLDLLIEMLPADSAEAARDNFRLRMTYDRSKDRSRTAYNRITEIVSTHRTAYLEDQAEHIGISRAAYQRIWVEINNIATKNQMGQFVLGLFVPMLLIIMVAVGGMYSAIDSTAGERENSTWETLMTVATSRLNIIFAKYLYVATMASVAGSLNFVAMVLSMKSVLAPILGDDIERMAFTVPWLSVPLIIPITILLALFIAAGMMILASFARTFKEAQSLVSPFYIAVIIPVVFLQTPGIEFTTTLAMIPIINICMVFREAIAGVYHWPQIGITIFVEIGSIILLLWLAAAILRYEDFLLGNYSGKIGQFFKERILRRKRSAGGDV